VGPFLSICQTLPEKSGDWAAAIIGSALTGLISPYLHMIAINNIITPACTDR